MDRQIQTAPCSLFFCPKAIPQSADGVPQNRGPPYSLLPLALHPEPIQEAARNAMTLT